MSTHYVVWCEDCEVFGPTIRDAAGGIVFAVLAQGTDGGQLDIDEVAKAAWREFLGEHEFHPLRLAREGSVPRVAHAVMEDARMADQDEWDPPNNFVVDSGLGVIHAQAKALAGLLEEALLHASEIMSLDGCEALKEAVADLDKAASGDLDDEFRAGLRKDGGDHGMLSNAANLSAACYSTLATLTALGTRGPVISEAWKRKGNPK